MTTAVIANADRDRGEVGAKVQVGGDAELLVRGELTSVPRVVANSHLPAGLSRSPAVLFSNYAADGNCSCSHAAIRSATTSQRVSSIMSCAMPGMTSVCAP